MGLNPKLYACEEIKRTLVQIVGSRNKALVALCPMLRVSSTQVPSCKRMALVPSPHSKDQSLQTGIGSYTFSHLLIVNKLVSISLFLSLPLL